MRVRHGVAMHPGCAAAPRVLRAAEAPVPRDTGPPPHTNAMPNSGAYEDLVNKALVKSL